jgi:hypothetical protein
MALDLAAPLAPTSATFVTVTNVEGSPCEQVVAAVSFFEIDNAQPEPLLWGAADGHERKEAYP